MKELHETVYQANCLKKKKRQTEFELNVHILGICAVFLKF